MKVTQHFQPSAAFRDITYDHNLETVHIGEVESSEANSLDYFMKLF